MKHQRGATGNKRSDRNRAEGRLIMAEEQASETLIARVAEHDEEALGEIYARFAPGLLGMLLRILPHRDSAEEVIDNVFLRLWKEAPRYPREGASLAAWLVIMARRTAIDLRRAQRKLPALSRNHLCPVDASFAWLPRPEVIARLEERRELLKKLFHQLPKPQRAALEMMVFKGQTEEEIAARLSEPLGRVRSGLRAGMRFLRHRLRVVLGTWAANI
jgi:RNA polymerase sigma-70 factor (ECF subfamily)